MTDMPDMDSQTASPQGQAGDMDKMHEAGIKKFVELIGKDEKFWKFPLEHKMDGDVKVFELVAEDIDWLVAEGQTVKAMAYNGHVPGPEIRITEGDKVRIVFTNKMVQSTAIHFHGLLIPNKMDGIPFITQPVVKKGETFTYEFTARNPGSHMYHSHHNAAEQVTKGLLGAFIIEPKDKSSEPQFDSDYTMVLNDSGIGFTINGKSFPYTQPIVAKVGERIRVRYMNEGLTVHPMHTHGFPMTVFARDGWAQTPFKCDTLLIGPGERWDVIIQPDSAGIWAFHCHILTHAESAHGMFGMVTAIVVNE
jgi:FtsP/CotA-like multicopper oxidase with cupredoxin domain